MRVADSKSPNKREQMANYSKWPQEPKEEDFKFSTAFSAKRPLVASTNVSGVEDQGSRLGKKRQVGYKVSEILSPTR